MNIDIEILKLIVGIIGGIVIAWYWNDQKHRLEQYRFVDEAYAKLLERYFANSNFGDAALTSNYTASFSGAEGLRYHYFAMAVHTAMETLFDLYNTKIPKEWVKIFEYHTMLHIGWLKDNQQLHEPDYVAYVLNIEARKRGAL